MKKVNTPQTVAHFFANKVQDEARNSTNNFYFRNETIFSYGSHFPIATHYKGVVLFTLDTYSVSTAKHIGLVRSACSHKDLVFCLNPESAAKGHHTLNVEFWVKNVQSITKNLASARKPENYIAQIAQEITNATEYCNFFEIKLNKTQKLALTLKDTTEYKEALLKEKQAKKLFEAQILSKGKKLFGLSVSAWQNYNETEFRKGLTERQKNLLNAYVNLQDRNETALRTNGTEVETTKGVKLPVAVAKRYYTWYLNVSVKGCVNCDYKILDYSVTEANKEHLVVGCHNIHISQINQLATRLNW